jgi:anthranilate synthase component 2
MNILIIDNYDSFTFNLYQLVGEIYLQKNISGKISVIPNDKLNLDEIKSNYQKIVISPGPGDPSDQNYFGACGQILVQLSPSIPTLGVCLGMQGLCHYYGGKVVRSKLPMHGKTSKINHNNSGIFANLPQNVEVMRYHSLVAEVNSLPKDLEITAFSGIDTQHTQNDFAKSSDMLRKGLFEGEIMGLRHKKFPIQGIQFHPESFATEAGKQMITNFLI